MREGWQDTADGSLESLYNDLMQLKDGKDYSLEKELDKPIIVRRLQGWVARDKNGELNLHLTNPIMRNDDWFNLYCIALDKEQFQELNWPDQPLRVGVVIGLNNKK